jgi:hypothetical protein
VCVLAPLIIIIIIVVVVVVVVVIYSYCIELKVMAMISSE